MVSVLEGVSFNTLIEIAVIGGGWIVTIVKIDSRLKNVERDIRSVTLLSQWRERMEERALTLRRDVDELRHGRGFVRDAIEGEWNSERVEQRGQARRAWRAWR
jgi:hypothetical protein